MFPVDQFGGQRGSAVSPNLNRPSFFLGVHSGARREVHGSTRRRTCRECAPPPPGSSHRRSDGRTERCVLLVRLCDGLPRLHCFCNLQLPLRALRSDLLQLARQAFLHLRRQALRRLPPPAPGGMGVLTPPPFNGTGKFLSAAMMMVVMLVMRPMMMRLLPLISCMRRLPFFFAFAFAFPFSLLTPHSHPCIWQFVIAHEQLVCRRALHAIGVAAGTANGRQSGCRGGRCRWQTRPPSSGQGRRRRCRFVGGM